MKTSTLQSLLVAAGITFTPVVMWAQSSPTPAPVTPPQQTRDQAATPTPQGPAVTATADPVIPDPQNADVSKSAKEQFALLDVNGDRIISREEFTRFADTDPNPARDAGSSTGVGRNGTGPGTAGSTTGSTGGVTGANNDANRDRVKNKSHDERFTELDINVDGSLTIEEFARVQPSNLEAGRDAGSSTGVGRNGTGPGTAGSTTGSTEASTTNPSGKKEEKR